MALYTNVLENGQWVTRQVDSLHLFAQNRPTEVAPVIAQNETPMPPPLGILTRTLVRTPVIKWIIPARVRHPDKNDVLYITSNSVEIKEVKEDYTLERVCIKDDFDASIRAARICGRPRLPSKGNINVIIPKEEPPDDTHRDIMDEDMDDGIKTEDGMSTGEARQTALDDEERRTIGGVPLSSRTLPPHILVLTLDSHKLVFLYAVSGDKDAPCLISSIVPLYQTGSYLGQLGEHVAVDPRSRAIAVGAHENLLYIYAMRSMDALEEQVKSQLKIEPILSERALRVDGTILKMEFLHPVRHDDADVTLLLISSKEGRSRMCWYQWDSSIPLHQAELKPRLQRLAPEEQVPILLIPLLYFSSFLLMTERRLVLFKDSLTGPPQKITIEMTAFGDPEEPGASKRAPIWVQWARAMRHSKMYSATEDGIYLSRDDGVVNFLTIRSDLAHMIDVYHLVDKLGINVNSAFSVLDPGPQCDDLLAVGGDECQGGLWRVAARELGRNTSKTSNWTPLLDTTTLHTPAKVAVSDVHTQGSANGTEQRIFACTGKGRSGTVTEIRYGCPAIRSLYLDLEDRVEDGVLAVCAFYSASSSTSFIFLSMPKRTYMIKLEIDDSVTSSITPQLVAEHRILDFNNRTLTMSLTSGEHMIQVTENSIRSCHTSELDGSGESRGSRHSFGFSQIVAATIGIPGFDTLMLTALRTGRSYQLALGNVGPQYAPIGEPLPLEYRPSAVSLMSDSKQLIALVGCSDQRLRVYSTKQLNEPLQVVADFLFEGEFGICESIAHDSLHKVETRGEFDSEVFIACGLRNGTVTFLLLQASGSSERLSCIESLEFGQTPVNVVATSSRGVFVVHCLDVLCYVDLSSSGNAGGSATVRRIWITDEEKPEWQRAQISAVAIMTIRQNQDTGPDESSLVYIDHTKVQLAKMGRLGEAENVPRQIKVGGTPSRLLYSKLLKKLIILSHETIIVQPKRESGNKNYPGIRAFQPVITFLDPDYEPVSNVEEELMQMDKSQRVNPEAFRKRRLEEQLRGKRVLLDYKPGEKFLGITEWFPKTESHSPQMLVINTSIRADAKKGPGGRVLIYAVSHQNAAYRLLLRKEIPHTTPVYSVAPYAGTNMVFYSTGCEGRDSYIHGFTVVDEPGRLSIKSLSPTAIHSPARHITFKDQFMYLSTTDGSLMVYELVGVELHSRYSDTLSRNGIHHLHVPEYSLTLAADAGKSIIGLWNPPHQPINNDMPLVFEAADLTHTVTRLQRIEWPIWYRHKSISPPMAFLGTCTGGTIIQILLLPPNVWPLLLFLQSFAQRSTLTAPFPATQFPPPLPSTGFSAYISSDAREVERSRNSTPGIQRHVNGDLLIRMLESGDAAGLLARWFDQSYSILSGDERPRGDRGRLWAAQLQSSTFDDDDEDFDDDDDNNMNSDVEGSAEAREECWTLFVELAIKALELQVGEEEHRRFKQSKVGRREMLDMVVRWVSWLDRIRSTKSWTSAALSYPSTPSSLVSKLKLTTEDDTKGLQASRKHVPM